jgi:flagellar biosynthetic protein FlhB
MLAAAPIVLVCALAGVAITVLQVGLKPTFGAIKPTFSKLNPLTGFKNMFGPRALVETLKSLAKVSAVGGIVALAVIPQIHELAALVGLPASALLGKLAASVMSIAQRAAGAYLVIAFADVIYQRKHFEKTIRMDKQEVKDEFKQHGLPPEVRAALRRRQAQAARARMMAAVPGADVVVTNPTHVAVALVYDGSKPAPEVVAKGQDLIAMQIRRVAEENDVPVISDPPLARSINSTVEVGHQIPEELFQGVAQLLAFVYRTAGRKVS